MSTSVITIRPSENFGNGTPVVVVMVVNETDNRSPLDYWALPKEPRLRLSPLRMTVAPFWPAVMPFL